MWGNDEAVKMNATFYSSFSSNFSAQTPSDEVVFDKEYDILEKLVIGTVFFFINTMWSEMIILWVVFLFIEGGNPPPPLQLTAQSI